MLRTTLFFAAFGLATGLSAAAPSTVIHLRVLPDIATVAIDPEGDLLLASAQLPGQVAQVSRAGEMIAALDFSGLLAGSPAAVDACPLGYLGLIDAYSGAVYAGCGVSGTPVSLGGAEGWGLSEPQSIAYGPDRRVFVTDKGTQRVAVFDGLSGALLAEWGAELPEGLVDPRGLCVASDGVYVADAGAGIVWVFAWDGSLARIFGSGSLSTPVSVAVDGLGRAWVVDAGAQKVTVFSSAGDVVEEYSSSDETPFQDVRAVAVHADGLVAVADGVSGNLYLWETGVAFTRYPTTLQASKAEVPVRTASEARSALVAGPVPLRAGEPLTIQAPEAMESISWEILGLDQSRLAQGRSHAADGVRILDTAMLGSGVYYLKMTASSPATMQQALQKIVVVR